MNHEIEFELVENVRGNWYWRCYRTEDGVILVTSHESESQEKARDEMRLVQDRLNIDLSTDDIKVKPYGEI